MTRFQSLAAAEGEAVAAPRIKMWAQTATKRRYTPRWEWLANSRTCKPESSSPLSVAGEKKRLQVLLVSEAARIDWLGQTPTLGYKRLCEGFAAVPRSVPVLRPAGMFERLKKARPRDMTIDQLSQRSTAWTTI